MRITFTLITFLFILPLSAQEELKREFFGDSISHYIKKYDRHARLAYEEEDYDRAKFLFDSLIDHCLKGKYFDRLLLPKLKKGVYDTNESKKPIFMLTYASWCVPSKGEIPALNRLADELGDKVDFVVLFWDTKKKVKKIAEDYSENIIITYIDERENRHPGIVSSLKHSLGLPTSFYLDADKRIVNISRGGEVMAVYKAEEEAFTMNYNSFLERLNELLITNQLSTKTTVTSKDKP